MLEDVRTLPMPPRCGRYLFFRVADQRCGIQVLTIREIVRLPVSVASRSNRVRGLADLGGRIFPTVDLRILFGVGACPAAKSLCLVVEGSIDRRRSLTAGLLVDRLEEIARVEAADIGLTAEGGPNLPWWIAGYVGLGQTTSLLNVDRLLDAPEPGAPTLSRAA